MIVALFALSPVDVTASAAVVERPGWVGSARCERLV